MRINSIAISGLVTLNLHSLNNEGAEGNYLQTRQVQIVDKNGAVHSVNAISGDMFKHIQAEHLYNIATEEELALCNSCKKFDANRIVADTEFAQQFEKDAKDHEILMGALHRCVIDDAEGVLITSEVGGKKRAIARKSAVEFGWLVGRPETTQTDSFFHVKFVPEGRGKGSGDKTGSANTGQNIFHRPASSGQYAVVLHLDLFRIGRNDITMNYDLSDEERQKRIKALLKSVLYTFIRPTGAHRNTQNPHIVTFEGSLAFSTSTIPAPTASPLNEEYRSEIASLSRTLNGLGDNQIEVREFDSMSEFAQIMSNLIHEVAPY